MSQRTTRDQRNAAILRKAGASQPKQYDQGAITSLDDAVQETNALNHLLVIQLLHSAEHGPLVDNDILAGITKLSFGQGGKLSAVAEYVGSRLKGRRS